MSHTKYTWYRGLGYYGKNISISMTILIFFFQSETWDPPTRIYFYFLLCKAHKMSSYPNIDRRMKPYNAAFKKVKICQRKKLPKRRSPKSDSAPVIAQALEGTNQWETIWRIGDRTGDHILDGSGPQDRDHLHGQLHVILDPVQVSLK